MKIVVTALIVMFAFSIIFASSQDAFAQEKPKVAKSDLIKPKVASMSLFKSANATLGLNPTTVKYTYNATNTGTQSLICRTTTTTGLIDIPLGAITIPNTNIPVGQSRVFTFITTITATTMNTATLTCRTDAGALVSATSNKVTVEIFQPSVLVTKDGPSLSKVGDDVQYNFTITNTGSANSPNLIKDSIIDTLLGGITASAPPACTSLAPSAFCSFSVFRTVMAGDPDPLNNTVTVHYHSFGFTNDVTDSDDHSVNLFQPSILVEKTGDALSKVGDVVQYDFTITNTGSADSPNLIKDSIIDTLLGGITASAPPACTSLAPSVFCSFPFSYTVLAGDPDPLNNTVTVHYHPDGFPNDVTGSDSHSVNLFQPSVQVIKDGPATANVGDDVQYNFTITNTGSADSPNLVYDFTIDSLIGPLDGAAQPDCNVLAPLASCSFSVNRTALVTDPNPLNNTVTVHYHPDGFPNDVTDSDDHSVQIIKTTSVKVIKMADPSLIEVGETVTYTVDITNTSLITVTLCNGIDDNGTPFDSSDDIDVDALMGGPFSLAPGGSKTFTYQKVVNEDTKNTVEFVCLGPDNTPIGDMAMAQVTVLVVGGNYMPIDSTALLLASVQTSATWLVPTIAGLAGIGLYLVKFRIREN